MHIYLHTRQRFDTRNDATRSTRRTATEDTEIASNAPSDSVFSVNLRELRVSLATNEPQL